MITVSNAAKEHAFNLIKEENKPVDTFIRVGVDGGGCSGETLLDCLNDVESKLV